MTGRLTGVGAGSAQTVLYHRLGRVGVVLLNRPARRNALDRESTVMLLAAVEQAVRDDTRCVVLAGAGGAFCVGGDLEDDPEAFATIEDETAWTRRFVRSAELLHEMAKPTIAAVRGACAGIGFNLACAADLRYASSTALFVTAYRTAALSGDGGGSWTLPRIVGDGKARELFYLSPRVDAGEALRIGLVNEVVDDPLFEGRVLAVAEQLADGPPLALQAMKANFNEAASRSLTAHLDSETVRHVACRHTADAAEAADAFLAKRKARFTGL
jgi:2-(1,2-epoxy-1,2-dihydrophenyl)acetyl-CoA isomerase